MNGAGWEGGWWEGGEPAGAKGGKGDGGWWEGGEAMAKGGKGKGGWWEGTAKGGKGASMAATGGSAGVSACVWLRVCVGACACVRAGASSIPLCGSMFACIKQRASNRLSGCPQCPAPSGCIFVGVWVGRTRSCLFKFELAEPIFLGQTLF